MRPWHWLSQTLRGSFGLITSQMQRKAFWITLMSNWRITEEIFRDGETVLPFATYSGWDVASASKALRQGMPFLNDACGHSGVSQKGTGTGRTLELRLCIWKLRILVFNKIFLVLVIQKFRWIHKIIISRMENSLPGYIQYLLDSSTDLCMEFSFLFFQMLIFSHIKDILSGPYKVVFP